MEQEQIAKRVEWLDEERRSDKNTIAELQKRIANLEGSLDKAGEQIRELGSDITRLSVLVAKVDKFDESLAAHRVEVKKELDEWEERRKRRQAEAKKIQNMEVDGLSTTLEKIRAEVEAVERLKAEMESRVDEVSRLQKIIAETQEEVRALQKSNEEGDRTLRSLEDAQRQEEKRMADLQGEASALRKRSDEFRAQMELTLEGQRKIETRLNELLGAEKERREAQNSFFEKAAFEQAERDRTWRDWEKRFQSIEKQSQDLESHLKAIETTSLAVKRAQETFQEINEQVNRRINEITEMQRLGEERFRQEWSTFRADDQKRWTNYTLTQEEKEREASRQREKLTDRVTDLEDNQQEIQDILQHLSEHTGKLFQTLLASVRDWIAENERFRGSAR